MTQGDFRTSHIKTSVCGSVSNSKLSKNSPLRIDKTTNTQWKTNKNHIQCICSEWKWYVAVAAVMVMVVREWCVWALGKQSAQCYNIFFCVVRLFRRTFGGQRIISLLLVNHLDNVSVLYVFSKDMKRNNNNNNQIIYIYRKPTLIYNK